MLSEQNLPLSEVAKLELIGGSSHIPFLRSELERFFERPVKSTCNADETVAEGCTFRVLFLL